MKASLNSVTRRLAVSTTLLALMAVSPFHTFAQSDSVWGEAERVQRAISEWDYPTARERLAALESVEPDHWAVLFARGRLRYHQGSYDEALEALIAAEQSAPINQVARIGDVRSLVADTARVVDGFETYRSPDGLFEIRYEGPRDAVLMKWAGETLDAAYYNIGYSTGFWPEAPIRVEIYPRAENLAEVSSLPLEAVETTSTIGLCKYNKLMFASPRSALRGYGWRDTLAHEYTHLVISRASRNRVPVWLHEALAKYLERRWRGEWDMTLEPSREDLLSERIEAGDLVTFEEMSPSIALLPTQEDASVAYAEVFTVIEYLVQRRGHGAIHALLVEIRDGASPEEAFAAVVGEPWSVFEANWMSWLVNDRPRVDLPGEFNEEIELVSTLDEEAGSDDFAGVGSPAARDYLRLGELLRAREHVEASIIEYRKAEALLGAFNPAVQSSLARALIDLGRYSDAEEAVREVRQWYPNYYLSELYYALALMEQGRHEEALPALEEAIGVNPFDGRVQEALAEVYTELGRPEDAQLAREHAELVGGGEP